MEAILPLKPLVQSLVYSLIGLVMLGISFLCIIKLSPFSVRKEIEEDQNTSLAILMGSVFIALAIIIQAAIRG